MFLDSYLTRLFPRRPRPDRAKSGNSTRLMEVELLENRLAPATIYVNNLNDGIVNTAVTNYLDGKLAVNLRSAVAYANAHAGNDTILLKTAVYRLNNSPDSGGGQIFINNGGAALTIRNRVGGVNDFSTIDAEPTNENSASRIFEVYGGGLTTLKRLILTHGAARAEFSVAQGGAIYNNGGDLSIQTSKFVNNSATGASGFFAGGESAPIYPQIGRGGGIHNDNGGKLTIVNTTFDSNTATGGDGFEFDIDGAGAEGGALSVGEGSGPVSITASTFSNNHAIGGDAYGGEISYGGVGEENSFGGDALGGAIRIFDDTLAVNVVNSTFAFNDAMGGEGYFGGNAFGGAIQIGESVAPMFEGLGPTVARPGSINLVNDTIAFNKVIAGDTGDLEGEISGLGDAFGGGVANFGGGFAVNVLNTIIAKNIAEHPGAVSNPSDVYGSFTSLGHNLIGSTDTSTGFTDPNDLTGTSIMPRDPGLFPTLENNGGPTKTLALLAYSEAIHAADNRVVANPSALLGPLGIKPLTTDQRGGTFKRKVGPAVDIGAYELRINLNRLFVFHSSNVSSVTFHVPNTIYAGLLAGVGSAGLLPGQSYEVVPIPFLTFGPGTVLKVRADGSFDFTVPKQYNRTVSFLFSLQVRDTSDEVDTTFPTNWTFRATIIVTPPGRGRGSAGNFLGLGGFVSQSFGPPPSSPEEMHP